MKRKGMRRIIIDPGPIEVIKATGARVNPASPN